MLKSPFWDPNTHTDTFAFLLLLFMYLRVPSITVYPVCTQPADLMSPVFIYLRLLGKEGGEVTIQSCPDWGKLSSEKQGQLCCVQLSAFGNFTEEQNHNVSQLLRGCVACNLWWKQFLNHYESAPVVLELSLFCGLVILIQGFSVSGGKPSERKNENVKHC